MKCLLVPTDQILVIVVIVSAPSDGSLEGAAWPSVACLGRLTAAILNCNIDTLVNTQYWVRPQLMLSHLRHQIPKSENYNLL